jgi:hypothetical protein
MQAHVWPPQIEVLAIFGEDGEQMALTHHWNVIQALSRRASEKALACSGRV